MATTSLGTVLDQVKQLAPDEQRLLREAIDQLLAHHDAPPSEDEFEQELLEAGVLDQLPRPPDAGEPSREWKPIDVKGKPISETIIEDRR